MTPRAIAAECMKAMSAEFERVVAEYGLPDEMRELVRAHVRAAFAKSFAKREKAE